MTAAMRKDFRLAANVLAAISALATVWCYFWGYSGFEAWLFAALGAVCCLMQPRIWAYVINHWRDLGVPALTVGIAAGVLCSWTDLTSNFQTIASARGLNVQDGAIATTNHKQAHQALAQANDNLEQAKNRLETMRNENPWLATATVAGLQAQIANQEGDFIFKRSKACADVTLTSSRAFCDRLASLRERAGIARQRDLQVARIDELQGQADLRRQAAQESRPGESRAYMQAFSMASLLSWDGSAVSEVARQNLHNAINVGLAVALWLLPTALAVFGYAPAYEMPRSAPAAYPGRTPEAEPRQASSPPAGGGGGGGGGHSHELQPVDINVPVRINRQVVGGDEFEHDVNHRAEATVHEIRPRPRMARDLPAMPSRRIVRVRDTKFARRVATLTRDYEARRATV